MYDFDLIVIGSGPAGEKAAIQAARLGAKVAVVEKDQSPGGASVLTGTIPSKAVRETACYINHLKKKELHGFAVYASQTISALDVLHRHHVISHRRSEEILDSFQDYNIGYITSKASFVDQHTIALAATGKQTVARKISAQKIIIAVGSRPFHPPDVKFDHKYILDSDTILKIDKLPQSLIIYGAGVIGCEYASIFNSLGAKVFLISPQKNLLSFLDVEISAYLKNVYQTKGIELYLGEKYTKIKAGKDKVTITLESGKTMAADFLLYANGRQGNSQDLSLSKCGLEANSRAQLDVNKFFQTTIPHIYAVGDVIGFPALASVANEQGRSAAGHAVKGYADYPNLNNIPLGIYTIPEIAMVGLTEELLVKKNIDYQKGICYFKELARAELLGEEEGLLKLLYHSENKKLLGVHIIGYYASDLIHIGQAVIYHSGSIDYFLKETINFPTLSSSYKVAAWSAALNTKEKLDEKL